MIDIYVPAKKRYHLAHGFFKHISKEGELLWRADNMPNIWCDEGELVMLTSLFAGSYANYGTTPLGKWNLYVGLGTQAPAEGNTLAQVTGEQSPAYGYARQPLVVYDDGTAGKDWVITQPAAAYQAASKTITFTASGGAWSAVTCCFLCTHPTATTSGQYTRLLCEIALSTSRTLQNGDSLQVSLVIGLSE